MNGPGAAGVVLEGKYRLLEELGTGAMGTVFRAWDESLDRPIAVKFLLPELEVRQDLVKRFQREARAMASVTHENVASINAFGTHGSAHFFVMEYVEGESADRLLEAARKTGRLPPLDVILPILDQVAAGLGAVHRAGVVHRDIKPGNIIVESGTGRVVITDFGLVRRYGKGERMGNRGVGGTPGYLAPEIIAERPIGEGDDFLTDIYAYGATAFELLTTELPFNEDSVVLMLQAHLTTPPRRPSAVRSEVPEALDEIVLRCLAKKPGDRFPSCEAIREALAEVQLPPAKSSKPSGPPAAPTAAPRTTTVRDHAVPLRVLIAHPDLGRRKDLAAAAREAIPSCRVWSVATAGEALRMAREHAPLVLVASVGHPSLDGLVLASEVKADPRLRSMRVVVAASRPLGELEKSDLEAAGIHALLEESADRESWVTTLRRSIKPKGGPGSPRPR